MDIAQNSLAAGAKNILISLVWESDALDVRIADDGCGMEPSLLTSAAEPFSTTRGTRRVGLGLPLFKLAAEQTGGSFNLSSRAGAGTTVCARYIVSHIDAPPLGDTAARLSPLSRARPSRFHAAA